MTETRGTADHERDIRADYRTMAERYDTLRSMEPCARRLVELAALPPGAQVLDIATGTGWVALAAAEHVGPTGRVLGVGCVPGDARARPAESDCGGPDQCRDPGR